MIRVIKRVERPWPLSFRCAATCHWAKLWSALPLPRNILSTLTLDPRLCGYLGTGRAAGRVSAAQESYDEDFHHTYYNQEGSSSYKPLYSAFLPDKTQPAPFHVKFGDGDNFRGDFGTETLQLGSSSDDDKKRRQHRFEEITFAIVNQVEEFNGLHGFDGVFGLGLESAHRFTPAVVKVTDTFGDDNKLFSVYLPPFGCEDNTGEILFGDINSNLFSGRLRYTPRASKAELKGTSKEEWIVSASVAFDGPNNNAYAARNAPWLVDTGAADIYAPSALVDSIVAAADAIKEVELSGGDGDRYYHDGHCDPLWSGLGATLKLTYKGGGELELTANDMFALEPDEDGDNWCTLRVVQDEDDDWILGQPFIEKYYTVFVDHGNDRMGFALANHKKKKC